MVSSAPPFVLNNIDGSRFAVEVKSIKAAEVRSKSPEIVVVPVAVKSTNVALPALVILVVTPKIRSPAVTVISPGFTVNDAKVVAPPAGDAIQLAAPAVTCSNIYALSFV